jgi:hypothetical protein
MKMEFEHWHAPENFRFQALVERTQLPRREIDIRVWKTLSVYPEWLVLTFFALVFQS